MQATSNLFDIARDRRNTTEKRERKTKNGKKSNYSKKFFFTFTFSYKKKQYFVRKHIWKNLYCYICITVFLQMYYSILT